MQRTVCASVLTLFNVAVLANSSYATELEALSRVAPEEIVSLGGVSSGMAQSGAASVSDQGAIHLNPAMLYLHRTYDVGAGYFWPVQGRPFYKLSVIDGVTSRWVAGLEYTGFQDSTQTRSAGDEIGDSPVHKRGSLAISIPTDFLAIGFAAHYVEAEDATEPSKVEAYSGVSLGVGLVSMLGKQFRLGASIENFNNKRVAAVAPQISRLGLAWEDPSATVSMHAEYRQQQALAQEFLQPEPTTAGGTESLAAKVGTERMALAGIQVKSFDILKLFAGYGSALGNVRREVASAGIGIFQKNFSFSYAATRPDSLVANWQSSLHLSLTMKI